MIKEATLMKVLLTLLSLRKSPLNRDDLEERSQITLLIRYISRGRSSRDSHAFG